jgi:ABC-type glutathione transport system ATPase component
MTLLDVKNLSNLVETKDGWVPAVKDISFRIDPGECWAGQEKRVW